MQKNDEVIAMLHWSDVEELKKICQEVTENFTKCTRECNGDSIPECPWKHGIQVRKIKKIHQNVFARSRF